MTLDEKLIEIGVKRMLVVDDKSENIDAAREYFKKYSQVQVDYAQSAEAAISMIKDAYASQKYDLVLSDLEMEERMSGLKVIAEVARYQGTGLIVTGKDRSQNHGPTTMIIGTGDKDGLYPGTKSETSVWQKIVERVSDYICGEGKELYDVLQMYCEIHRKPSDEIMVDLIKKTMEIDLKRQGVR